jgi:hypothetical protein
MSEENGGNKKEEEGVEFEVGEDAEQVEIGGEEGGESDSEEENGDEEHAPTDKEQEQPPLWRRALNWSKAAKGWAAVISIVGATGLGFYGAALKKDPEAAKAKTQSTETWQVLSAQVNTLTTRLNKLSRANGRLWGAVNKLSRRVVFLQAHEEGFRHGATHERMLQLQRENEALRKGRGLPAVASGASGDAGPSLVCKKGFIEVGGKCRRVNKDVAGEVMRAKAEAMAAKARAAVEARRRKEAEAAKLAQQAAQKPAPKIKLLPKSLGAAKKMLKKKEKMKMEDL